MSGAEDFNLWIRLILDGARAGMVNEPLGRYRLRSGSLSDRHADVLMLALMAIEDAVGRNTSGLSRHELDVLDRRLGLLRPEAALAGLEQALLADDPGARDRGMRIARSGGFSPRTRLKAAAAMLAPALARRALVRRSGERRSRSERPAPRSREG